MFGILFGAVGILGIQATLLVASYRDGTRIVGVDKWDAVAIGLERRVVEDGRQVFIDNPHNPLWRGRAAYVEKRFKELIMLVRQEKLVPPDILETWILPIRVGVVYTKGAQEFPDAQAWGLKVIEVASHIFEDAKDGELDLVLVHEFSHKIRPYTITSNMRTSPKHHEEWSRVCTLLYKKLTGESFVDPKLRYGYCDAW